MRGVVLAVLAVLAMLSPARAEERVVIDQVVVEPSTLGGQRLRIYVSALSLQGQVLELADVGGVRVNVDGRKLDSGLAIGTFAPTQTDTAIVVVTQISSDFSDVLPVINEALDTNLFDKLNEKLTQVALLGYGESIAPGKLASMKAARGRVASIVSDGSVGEPILLDSIERAIVLLRKATTKPEGKPLRKMILIIGDGRDASNDRDRVTRVGQRAAAAGIRIHSLAYSPKDVRRPLLLLGELSKKSLGTFRWVRGAKADSWSAAFEQLAAEVNRQSVITVFTAPDEDMSGKKVKVELTGRSDATYLNEGKAPPVQCAGQVCEAGQYCAANSCVAPRQPNRRGILGWVMLIGGGVLGLLAVLWVIGFVMTKRQQLASQVGVAEVPANLAVQGAPQVPQSRPPKTIAFHSQPPAEASMSIGMPVSGARLSVISGPYAGRDLPLKHGFFIGKASGCDLLLDDGFTSGHHAQFVIDGSGKVTLFDYGSTNGTFVNGQKISSVVLEHGSTIKIGSTEIRFLAH
jgi:hypothetical protein